VPAHLRIYPVPFARAVADLLESMKSSAYGQPQLPQCLPTAKECMELEWVGANPIWQFADLPSLFSYLRMSKALKIPVDWKGIVPKTLSG